MHSTFGVSLTKFQDGSPRRVSSDLECRNSFPGDNGNGLLGILAEKGVKTVEDLFLVHRRGRRRTFFLLVAGREYLQQVLISVRLG